MKSKTLANGIQSQFSLSKHMLTCLDKVFRKIVPRRKGVKVTIHGSQVTWLNRQGYVLLSCDIKDFFNKDVDFVYRNGMFQVFKPHDMIMVMKGDPNQRLQKDKLVFGIDGNEQYVDIPYIEDKIGIPLDLSKATLVSRASFDKDEKGGTFVRKDRDDFKLQIDDSGNLKIIDGSDHARKFHSSFDDSQKSYLELVPSRFLNFKANDYVLSIWLDENNQHWLITEYEFKVKSGKQFVRNVSFTTYEKVFEPGKGTPNQKRIIPLAVPDRAGLETSLVEAFQNLSIAKILVYKYCVPLYRFRHEYFTGKKEKKYIEQFTLYIQDLCGQEESTFNHDFRVIMVLSDRFREDVLDRDPKGLVSLLQVIAYAPESLVDELLDDIEKLDAKSARERVAEYRAKNEPDENKKAEKVNKRKTDLLKAVKKLNLPVNIKTMVSLVNVKRLLAGFKAEELEEMFTPPAKNQTTAQANVSQANVQQPVAQPQSNAQNQPVNQSQTSVSNKLGQTNVKISVPNKPAQTNAQISVPKKADLEGDEEKLSCLEEVL